MDDETRSFLLWIEDFDMKTDGLRAFRAMRKLDEIQEIATRGGKGSLDEIRRALT